MSNWKKRSDEKKMTRRAVIKYGAGTIGSTAFPTTVGYLGGNLYKEVRNAIDSVSSPINQSIDSINESYDGVKRWIRGSLGYDSDTNEKNQEGEKKEATRRNFLLSLFNDNPVIGGTLIGGAYGAGKGLSRGHLKYEERKDNARLHGRLEKIEKNIKDLSDRIESPEDLSDRGEILPKSLILWIVLIATMGIIFFVGKNFEEKSNIFILLGILAIMIIIYLAFFYKKINKRVTKT